MRIVSLSPSITEIIQSFGLHENLAGITSECPAGFGKSARVGSPKTLDIQAIVKLAPDLIVTERKENRPEEIRELNKHHEVISWDVITIASVIGVISELGKLINAEGPAKELIRSIYQVWPTPPQDPVRTVALVWSNPMSTVSHRSYVSQLIEAAGGWNLYREDPVPEVAIELEDMFDMDSEVLLLASEPYTFDIRLQSYFKGLPSFAKKQVHLIDGFLFSRFGPQTVKALKTLGMLMQNVRAERK